MPKQRLNLLAFLILLGTGLVALGLTWPAQAAAPLPSQPNNTPDSSSNRYVQSGIPPTGTIVYTYYIHLPLVSRAQAPEICQPIEGANYGSFSILGQPSDRPAEEHGDLNLALRGYRSTTAFLGLIDYDGATDPKSPQLAGLFAAPRPPTFTAAYQVHHWDWDCNCRDGVIEDPEVTLTDLAASQGETVHVPDSGYTIGAGYEVLVLYASDKRVTLKYTREDNVVRGYTLHLEDVCVDPNLVALYRTLNEAGRHTLPALRAGQAFGYTHSNYVRFAIRDNGTFLDPRSRKDWWHGYVAASSASLRASRRIDHWLIFPPPATIYRWPGGEGRRLNHSNS